jgi:hypothetical protein
MRPRIDATRLTPDPLTYNKRNRAEALAELGVTRPESALFTAIYYGFTIPPSDLPSRAAQEDYNPNGPRVTEEECRVALAGCLAKDWMQVIEEPARTRIRDDLRRGRVLGPIYGGLPEVGCVDFTDTGADLWRRLCEQCWPDREFATYTDVVHEKTARFFRTKSTALAAIEESRRQDEVVAVNGPTPTGPWCAQWWRRFPEGYRIDIEERRRWQGRASGGGEYCYLDYSARNRDPDQLRHVLDRHVVALAEWIMLEYMERGWFRDSAANLCCGAAESAIRLLCVAISQEQCNDGLEACLRNGWLRVVDQHTDDEVKSLLGDAPMLLAVPRIAENCPRECCYAFDPLRPGKLVPIPMPAARRWGEIDFSPAGATLYRMILAEWLGPDWEDDLSVSRGYYWEEHHYCEAEESVESVVQGHVAKGDVVRARRVVPIGLWCVQWWQQFPSGYRLELELGTP